MTRVGSPAVSVIIPTHERRARLEELLRALEAQVDAPPFEVVMVDDGSRDGTAAWLQAWRGALALRVLVQENRGPAAARNAGLRQARGALVAFLGDDTVPAPDWLACHVRRHAAANHDPHLAVIGYTTWHTRVRRTAFLDFINEQGPQFGYALIHDADDVPFNFLYTSNLSLPRALLEREPFDERFPHAAWEDVETAYRLRRHGLRLVYERAARTAHDHPTDVRRFGLRQQKAGECAVVFHALHPELGGFLGLGPEGPPAQPAGAREWALERLAIALEPLPLALPRVWARVLRRHYVIGLRRGWARRATLFDPDAASTP
jgi:glycosyltransferase involved in cell wall biosynthesis